MNTNSSSTPSSSSFSQEMGTDSGDSELRRLIDEAETLLAQGADQAGAEYDKLRERFSAALSAGKTRFNEMKDAACKQAARADEMIHARPYTAIGIAAGVGLLAGYLVSRNCRCTRG